MARGLGPHQGALTSSAIQDIVDGDAFEGPATPLTGTADIINPHVAGNYLINSASADAMTLAAPTAGVDDGLSINLYSTAALVHTLTCPSTIIATGSSVLRTVATWTTGFIGQGIGLRAYNGIWYVVAMTGTVTFT